MYPISLSFSTLSLLLHNLTPHLVIPLTLDPVSQLLPLMLHIYPQPRAVFCLTAYRLCPCSLISSWYYPIDFMKPFFFLDSCLPFCRHQHSFQKGDIILTLITFTMRSLRWHRVNHHFSLLSLTPLHLTSTQYHVAVGITLRLLQLFYTSRRPLNLLGHQCLWVIDTSYSHPYLYSEDVHHHHCHPLISNHLGGHYIYLHHHTTLVTILHILSYMTGAWGMPALFVYKLYFSDLEKGSVR